jgi:hypothetical protein
MNRVPDGIHAALKLSAVARVLNLPERRVRSWVESGVLDCVQMRAGSARYVPTASVMALADLLEVEPNWLEAIE